MRGVFRPVFLGLAVFILAGPGLAAYQEQQADLPRDEDGVAIAKKVHVRIPDERKIAQVSNNVVRAEEEDKYVTRILEDMDARMKGLEERVTELENQNKQKKE